MAVKLSQDSSIWQEMKALKGKKILLDVKQTECEQFGIKVFVLEELPLRDVTGKFRVVKACLDGNLALLGEDLRDISLPYDQLQELIKLQKAKELKTFTIPVTWEMSTDVKVDALTLEEAKAIVLDDELPLPTDGSYIEGSFQINEDCLEALNKQEA